MKKHYLLSVLFATFFVFVSFHGAYAQGTASISGDELCGATAQTKCTLANIKTIAQNMLYTFVAIGSVAMFIFIAYRFIQSQFAVMGGNAGARMIASKNIFGALQGFFIVVAVGALFAAALKLLGTQEWTTKLLQMFSDAFIPRAYAADERLLPNPLFANNLFELIMAIMNLVIKFFIYPAIIVLWVWSGFQFVYSQGNPEGLKKAKNWILWTFIITVVIFTLQGFLLSFKNTAQKIAPQNAAFVQPSPTNTNTDGRTAPADGQLGSVCTTPAGTSGTRGTDGLCTSRSDSYAGQPVTSCNGQRDGTVCALGGGKTGTCGMSNSSESGGGVYGCYAAPAATSLVGAGGRCELEEQCAAGLHCINFICK